MGDDSIKDVRPGDLIVNLIIRNHNIFQRNGDNILCEKQISVWDALLGTNLEIETLDRKKLNIVIPAGTQPDTVLSCNSEGLPNIRTKRRGSLLLRVKIEIPRIFDETQKELIKKLKNGL
jgi:molecular chaperone DnaJ